MEKYDEKNYRAAIMYIDGFLKRTKMKQRELAEAVGLTSGMITAIKQGRSETTHSVCAKMLLAGMTVEELFAKDGVALQADAAYWRCQDGVTTDN